MKHNTNLSFKQSRLLVFGLIQENEMNVEVNLVPDYITLGDKCSAQSQIRFCSECIKIEVPDIYNGEYVHLNWTIDDLVHIRCQFNESVGFIFIFN